MTILVSELLELHSTSELGTAVYKLIECDGCTEDGEHYIGYGISIDFTGDDSRTVSVSRADISTDISAVKRLLKRMADGFVTPRAFEDIIYDFIR